MQSNGDLPPDQSGSIPPPRISLLKNLTNLERRYLHSEASNCNQMKMVLQEENAQSKPKISREFLTAQFQF
jgi:hypothetical protein